jgi:hypothetical protein
MLIYLTRDPSDGPPPSTPYVSIFVDLATANLLDGRQLSVVGDHADAFAKYNRTATDYESASAGYVTANFSATDEEIVGIADITFAGAGHLIREFRAHVFPNSSLCP